MQRIQPSSGLSCNLGFSEHTFAQRSKPGRPLKQSGRVLHAVTCLHPAWLRATGGARLRALHCCVNSLASRLHSAEGRIAIGSSQARLVATPSHCAHRNTLSLWNLSLRRNLQDVRKRAAPFLARSSAFYQNFARPSVSALGKSLFSSAWWQSCLWVLAVLAVLDFIGWPDLLPPGALSVPLMRGAFGAPYVDKSQSVLSSSFLPECPWDVGRASHWQQRVVA